MLLRLLNSKKRCLSFILTGIFFYCFLIGVKLPVSADEINENELYSKAAVLMDGKTGRVLYGKNAYEEMPMASTTKIMTCIIALENADLDMEVEVSEYAASMPAVDLGMNTGEKYVLRDLLYSLMLESHNDTAVAIAEGVSGSVDKFLGLMNSKASELGCDNTLFLTPNGLDANRTDEHGIVVKHHSTASDMARIMSYCINESPKKKEFLEITRTQNYSFTDTSGERQFSCTNHNSFLTMMEGALSGKTGFTNDAGYCYVGALREDSKDFVVALLACGWPNNKNYKWSDTKKLMKYGLENYKDVKLDVPYKSVRLSVENGQYDLETSKNASVTATVNTSNEKYLMNDSEQSKIVYEIMENVEAPVRKGDVLGKIIYSIDDYIVYTGNIIAESEVEFKTLHWAICEILDIAFGGI